MLLFSEMMNDPSLDKGGYDVIILDEIHERGRNMDLCVG
jgi:HrpA-like RNA helicase